MTIRVDPEINARVRAITDEEVAFYHEHGWVKLERLVDPELAAEMLALLEPRLPGDARFVLEDVLPAKEGVEPFRSVVFGETMGRNAQRLINRRRLNNADVAVRYRQDVLVSKAPVSELPEVPRARGYHQDCFAHAPDRGGEMMFWLALEEVTPEMGSMDFLSGSHREGPLGVAPERETDLTDIYPNLLELYPPSEQMRYQPGDATVHTSWTAHSSPPNTTDRRRLGYIFMYSPADIRYFRSDRRGETREGGERVTLDDPWFLSSPIVVSASPS